MFNNIGRKIKSLAKFVFWVLSIIGILIGLAIMVSGFAAGNSSSNPIGTIFLGLIVAIISVIFAWLQTFLLFGFGELIDSNQKILKVLEEKQ